MAMSFKSVKRATQPVNQAGLFLGLCFLSMVAEAVTYSPYAFTSINYEDNLFRVANDAEAEMILNDDDPSDTIYRLGAGIEGDLNISRQSIKYDAYLYRSVYSNYSKLDHNGGAAIIKGNYEIGNLWFGSASYRLSRELSDFEQFQELKKSIKVRNQFDFDLHRRLTTKVNMLVGTGYKVVDFDDRTENGKNESNRTVVDYFAGLEYSTPLKNTIGVKYNHGRTKFPDRDTAPSIEKDNEYLENGIDVFTDWNISTQSQLKGSIGYLDREQENFSSGDFNGIVASLKYIWKPRAKLTVNTSVRRDLSSLEGEALNYVVIEGISIEPVWALTSKVQLYFGYTHEKRDFKGVSDLDVGIESSTRENTIDKYRLGMNYQPRRYIDIEVYYGAGERDSTDDLRDYDYNQFFANLTFSFR